MNLANLLLHPRRFFSGHTDSINWVWPLVGFYLFAFANYFQYYVVHDDRTPYWLVVYVISWAPVLSLAVGLFVLLVLIWYWPASMILGARQKLEQSTKIIGISLLPPGAVLTTSLLVLANIKSNGVAAPYPLMVGAVQSATGLWGLALIVLAAAASNKLTTAKTVLFVSWLAALVVVVGATTHFTLR